MGQQRLSGFGGRVVMTHGTLNLIQAVLNIREGKKFNFGCRFPGDPKVCAPMNSSQPMEGLHGRQSVRRQGPENMFQLPTVAIAAAIRFLNVCMTISKWALTIQEAS